MIAEDKWWQKDSNIPLELNDAPMIENNSGFIKNSEWKALHERLAKDVIDFFKEKGLPKGSWAINFGFDCLEDSVKHGKWCPMSDSSLELKGKNNETILFSM